MNGFDGGWTNCAAFWEAAISTGLVYEHQRWRERERESKATKLVCERKAFWVDTLVSHARLKTKGDYWLLLFGPTIWR